MCERHPGRRRRRIGTPRAPQSGATDPHAVVCQPPEGVTTADPGDQAERRARPLARRLFSTARPARVDIRARKPWRLARRWLLGWNVRFTSPPRPRWRARRPWPFCLLQEVMQHVRARAHVRPGKAIGRRRARDNRPPTPQLQVARHVLASRWIVLRSCACHAATGLSTPVDKRVDVRAESVSGSATSRDD